MEGFMQECLLYNFSAWGKLGSNAGAPFWEGEEEGKGKWSRSWRGQEKGPLLGGNKRGGSPSYGSKKEMGEWDICTYMDNGYTAYA